MTKKYLGKTVFENYVFENYRVSLFPGTGGG
jgi:hypothetical protein